MAALIQGETAANGRTRGKLAGFEFPSIVSIVLPAKIAALAGLGDYMYKLMHQRDNHTHPPAPVFTRRQVIGLAAATFCTLATGVVRVQAQSAYPVRPIKVVVPYAAGGSFDVLGRQISARISSKLGQNVFFENRPGAASQIGTQFVARATGDGYTLLFGTDVPLSILPALHKDLPYDPERDFTPLTMLCQASLALVTQSSFPATTLGELIAYAKANPGKVSYSTPGIGSQHHISMERLARRVGVEMLHVPYQGIGPAFTSMLSGEVNVMLAALALPLPHLRSGKLKALAYTGGARHPLLPATPTFQEAGIADFEVQAWFGIFAPSGIPGEIAGRLSSTIWEAVSSKEFSDTVLVPLGFDPNPSIKPEQFPAFLREDRKKWREAVAEIDPKKLAP